MSLARQSSQPMAVTKPAIGSTMNAD